MKRTSIFVFIMMAVILVTNVYAQTPKVVYLDLSRLFDEHPKTKKYDSELEAKHNDFTKKVEEKVEKIREAQGRLALLKEDKKQELEKEIEEMKADLLEFDRQERANLAKEKNEKITEILLEIEKIVSDFAEKEGYPIIINDRVLIYGDPKLNVTEKLLDIMSEAKSKKK